MVYSAIYINSYLNKYPSSTNNKSNATKSNATKSNATNNQRSIIENMVIIDYSFYS